MARTRTIRPDFWNDEKLASVSRDSRLTFIGLWTASDDYSIVRGHPIWLKNQIFPYDTITEKQMMTWLTELESIKSIVPYKVNGEKYYFIRSFSKHQKIDNPSKTRNPLPSQEFIDSLASVSLDNSFEIKLNKTKLKESKEKGKEGTYDLPSLWNSLVIDILPQVSQVTDKRKAKIRARLKETPSDFKTTRENRFFEYWELVIRRILESEFCCGNNDRGWKADFDWLLYSDTHIKVLEGKYDNKRNGTQLNQTQRAILESEARDRERRKQNEHPKELA